MMVRKVLNLADEQNQRGASSDDNTPLDLVGLESQRSLENILIGHNVLKGDTQSSIPNSRRSRDNPIASTLD